MKLTEAIDSLWEEYWRQCSPNYPGSITCAIKSGTGDNARIIRVTMFPDTHEEWCFSCYREQYGDWEECPMLAERTDWELIP